MPNSLEKFYKDNHVKIGLDFQVNPPIYYQSLNEGLFGYFNTTTNKKQSIWLLLFQDIWTRPSIAFNFTNSDATVSTILGLHRFFELLLKDILVRIDPFLAVKFLENEKQVIAYLNNVLISENVQTIEFSVAFERFKVAIKFATENPNKENYKMVLKFKFLIENGTLQQLAKWRNQIIHNGKTLPNIFALDFLVSQKIIPMVAQILELEKEYIKGYKPHYFNTPSGLNILDHFLQIKFNVDDFYQKPKPHHLKVGMLKIAHLKEIAKAMFGFDSLILKNQSFIEPYYDKPLDRCFRFAETERQNTYFHDIRKCICCGIQTLVVYKRKSTDIHNNMKERDYFFLRCTSCNYILPENMGDPCYYGLCPDDLFQ